MRNFESCQRERKRGKVDIQNLKLGELGDGYRKNAELGRIKLKISEFGKRSKRLWNIGNGIVVQNKGRERLEVPKAGREGLEVVLSQVPAKMI